MGTTIDKIIDFVFEKKEESLLALTFILGFILRLIIGGNIAPNADEAVYGVHAINIISSGVVNTQNQAIVWFYLQDIFYRLLGVTLQSARFASIIFGSLTILAVYLLTKQVFKDKKLAVLASLFYALSPYALRMMLMEMDPTVTFFVTIATYFFFKDLEKNKFPVAACIIGAIGFLVKGFSLFFLASFGLIYLLKTALNKEARKELFNKLNIKQLMFTILAIIIILLPIISYNYILYEQKGLTDVMFYRFFDVKNKEIFAPIADTLKPFSFSTVLHEGLPNSIKSMFFKLDPALTILFVLGAVLLIYNAIKHRKTKNSFEEICLLIAFFAAYLFTAGTAVLSNHFVLYIPLLAIISAYGICQLLNLVKNKQLIKNIMYTLVIVFIIYSVVMTSQYLTSSSGMTKLREYAIKNIDDNSLVIADSRIYNGRTAWLFNDKHYIDLQQLNQITTQLSNQPKVPIKTYFVECATDDCGWGTITAGELNDSMESAVRYFSNQSSAATFTGGGGYGEEADSLQFKVYQTTLSLPSQTLQAVDTTHTWFYYPVRWLMPEQRYDNYTPSTTFQKTLNSLAYIVLWLEIIATIIIAVYPFYEIYTETENRNQ